ncbi:unnamed protein product, partial [Polarella glacialis]
LLLGVCTWPRRPDMRSVRMSRQLATAVTAILSLVYVVGAGSAGSLPSRDACGGVDPAAWTSPVWEARGYHMICIADPASKCRGSNAESGECDANSVPTATVCFNGRRECQALGELPSELWSAELAGSKGLHALQKLLVDRGSLANPKRFNRMSKALEKARKLPLSFAFFSVPEGSSPPSTLQSTVGLSGMVLAFEGGSFLWPGVEVGFVRNLTVKHEKSE